MSFSPVRAAERPTALNRILLREYIHQIETVMGYEYCHPVVGISYEILRGTLTVLQYTAELLCWTAGVPLPKKPREDGIRPRRRPSE